MLDKEREEGSKQEEQAKEVEANPLEVKEREEPQVPQSKYLYLLAEFENYKRRATQTQERLLQRCKDEWIKRLLPRIDDFERALQEQKVDHKGVEMIYKGLQQTLKEAGVEKMSIQEDTSFNPDEHEALQQVVVEEERRANKVIDVLEEGYFATHPRRVLRYAKVTVGKKKEE